MLNRLSKLPVCRFRQETARFLLRDQIEMESLRRRIIPQQHTDLQLVNRLYASAIPRGGSLQSDDAQMPRLAD
jgi:hypothetical protein